MYPVFSVLRRMASHHIYATKEMLAVVDNTFHVRLDKPTNYLDLTRCVWANLESSAPLSCLSASAPLSTEAALNLSIKENWIAEQIRAPDTIYTMVVGPEDETQTPEGVLRVARFAVIRGIYRVSSSPVIVQQQTSQREVAQFRKPPPGTVRF